MELRFRSYTLLQRAWSLHCVKHQSTRKAKSYISRKIPTGRKSQFKTTLTLWMNSNNLGLIKKVNKTISISNLSNLQKVPKQISKTSLWRLNLPLTTMKRKLKRPSRRTLSYLEISIARSRAHYHKHQSSPLKP